MLRRASEMPELVTDIHLCDEVAPSVIDGAKVNAFVIVFDLQVGYSHLASQGITDTKFSESVLSHLHSNEEILVAHWASSVPIVDCEAIFRCCFGRPRTEIAKRECRVLFGSPESDRDVQFGNYAASRAGHVRPQSINVLSGHAITSEPNQCCLLHQRP